MRDAIHEIAACLLEAAAILLGGFLIFFCRLACSYRLAKHAPMGQRGSNVRGGRNPRGYPEGITMKLKEIAWGLAGDTSGEICIYANGHLPIAEFLEAVKSLNSSDVPSNVRCALTEGDVRHTRFHPMSPSEARGMGYDFGVMEAKEEHRGYAVTAVFL